MDVYSPETHKLDDDSLIELDAYSRDNQFLGRISGYVPEVPEDEAAFELTPVDSVGPDGRVEGKRHVVINGIGTILQALIRVPVDTLEVDLRGRRVTVPLTLAEIEAMPRHEPEHDAGRSA